LPTLLASPGLRREKRVLKKSFHTAALMHQEPGDRDAQAHNAH